MAGGRERRAGRDGARGDKGVPTEGGQRWPAGRCRGTLRCHLSPAAPGRGRCCPGDGAGPRPPLPPGSGYLGGPSRSAALPVWPGPSTGSGSRAVRRTAGTMVFQGAPAFQGAPLRWRLLLAVCWAVAAGTMAEAKLLPPPSNLNYSFIQMCTLNWTWNPPQNVSRSCNLEYSSDIVINKVPQDKKEWSKNLFRVTDALLDEEMSFQVRSECKHDNTSEPSPWVETSLQLKGIPGTAAVDLSCVWHNLEYMVCTWRPGENASSDTNYTLFYWFDGLKNPKKCSNYSTDQGIFGCIFNFTFPKVTNTYPTISILIRDDSEEIRPVCASKNPTTLVKPATPSQVTLSKINDKIDVKWSESETFPKGCLLYEVKYRNGDLDSGRIIPSEENSVSISGIDPDSKYIFKVKAKPKPDCYSSEFSSDWSEEKSIGEKRDSYNLFGSDNHHSINSSSIYNNSTGLSEEAEDINSSTNSRP
ncbi:interleukin-13 receptor subunit alpha-1 [Myiozetetes cayanensis]|uniref:interleukin-13 receptor subunit alpha-1 n=1 Tax=Myiozetetes cayanensis TaxID=478635 RepID=UPI0021604EA6|nr:interleukin-13 receptor subunit alpha-1 [Myiozetetes cayanensis]